MEGIKNKESVIDESNDSNQQNKTTSNQSLDDNEEQLYNNQAQDIEELDKYSKYLETSDNIEEKPCEIDEIPEEITDVFSDSSMTSGKKPSKFKQSAFYKKWSALAKWKRVTIIVVLVLIFVAAIACGVIFGTLNGFKGEKLDKDNLGILDNTNYNKSGYVNIAIFGLDTRSADSFKGRSDSIIIASVNKSTGSVKLTSILRDSCVPIEGHSSQKIAHAYSFGGAELAIKTINKNYNMNIEDYVTFNFSKLAGLIDLTGGVDVDITEEERIEMNRIGPDDGRKYTNVKSSGRVHLNGMQAVVYARIRKTDSDVERADRQKKVVMSLFNNVKGMGLTKYDDFVKKAMEFCETSLSSSEILSYSSMLSKQINIETLVIPGENTHAKGGMYNGTWVWRYDTGLAANEIHKFIYGNSATTVAATTTSEQKSTNRSTTNNSTSNTTAPQSTTDKTTTKPITTKPINSGDATGKDEGNTGESGKGEGNTGESGKDEGNTGEGSSTTPSTAPSESSTNQG